MSPTDGEIAQGAVGDVGSYDLAFDKASGKLVAKIKLDASKDLGAVVSVQGSLSGQVSVDAGAVIDALKLAIPGHFDDLALDAAKALLLGK